MSNRVQAFVSSYAVTGASGQSAFFTASFANTAGFDAVVPIKVYTPSSVSAGSEVTLFRSTDGGVTYETLGALSLVFARTSSAAPMIRDLYVRDPGIYLISVLGGGGAASTYSYDVASTIEITTAYA